MRVAPEAANRALIEKATHFGVAAEVGQVGKIADLFFISVCQSLTPGGQHAHLRVFRRAHHGFSTNTGNETAVGESCN